MDRGRLAERVKLPSLRVAKEIKERRKKVTLPTQDGPEVVSQESKESWVVRGLSRGKGGRIVDAPATEVSSCESARPASEMK